MNLKKNKLFAFLFCLILLPSCFQKKSSSGTSTKNNPVETGTGGGSTGGTTTGQVTKAYGVLFITTATFDGGFAYSGSGTDFSTADSTCASEATSKGLSGTFKAVVGAGTNREPSSKWVLKASTEYRRVDGTTVIGSTDSDGKLVFPLTNAIDTSATEFWTGLESNFTSSSYNCEGWTTNVVGPYAGTYGIANLKTTAAFNSGNTGCYNTKAILCAEIIPRTTTLSAQASYRKIFPTINGINGGNGSDGVARFDTQCNSDAVTKDLSEYGHASYKALVFSNSTSVGTRRISCLTADCANGSGEAVNWILEANTQYRRENGTTVIGTTTSNAIFSFPLTNSFTGTTDKIWTNINSTWAAPTNNASDTCSFFTSASISDYGRFGLGNDVGSAAVDSTTDTCNKTYKVLCVEQKRTQNVFVDYPGYSF